MRKYTFTLEELRTYEIEVDAESEVEARDTLQDMSVSQVTKELVNVTDLEEVNIVKGDFFEATKPKKKKAKK